MKASYWVGSGVGSQGGLYIAAAALDAVAIGLDIATGEGLATGTGEALEAAFEDTASP